MVSTAGRMSSARPEMGVRWPCLIVAANNGRLMTYRGYAAFPEGLVRVSRRDPPEQRADATGPAGNEGGVDDGRPGGGGCRRSRQFRAHTRHSGKCRTNERG